MTVHRILATLVMTRPRHVRTVRQKMQELTRNDRVRILLIKNFLCVRHHSRNNSLRAGKLLTRIPCQLQHTYRVNYKMRTVSIIQHAHRAGTCNFTVSCKSNQSEFRRNLQKLCNISKKANFRRYFDAPIVPISLKFRSNVRNFAWHFVLRTTKFHTTVYFGERNSVEHFVCWSRNQTECGFFFNDRVFTEISKYTHTHVHRTFALN